MNLEFMWQACRELDDAMVQKWRTNLERVRHAHAIRLIQDVVRQVVILIDV